MNLAPNILRAYDYLPEAVVILDASLQVQYLNDKATQLLDYANGALPMPLVNLIADLSTLSFRQECQRVLAQQREAHFEQFCDSLGIMLEISIYPYNPGLFICLKDATERKSKETALFEHAQLLTMTGAISEVLTQEKSLTDLLDRYVLALVNTLGHIAEVRVWIVNRDSNLLEQRAIATLTESPSPLPQRVPVGIPLIGLIAQTQQPYLTNDGQNDIFLGATDWMQSEQLVAFAGYPMQIQNRLIGVVGLFSWQALSPTTNHALHLVANNLALAIDQHEARDDMRSQRESLLFRLSSQIRNTLDLDKILNAVVQEIHNLLQIDRCYYLWCWTNGGDDGTPPQLYAAITHEAAREDLPTLMGECSAAQNAALMPKILNQAAIQVAQVNDATVAPELAELLASWGLTSLLFLPIETRSGKLGAIACGQTDTAHFWAEAELELLRGVTDQLAIAIDQAELYAQTRAAAFAAQTQAKELSDALEHLRQTEAQLIQSEKMSSLGQLVAGIAHEINNPVTFISGNLNHTENYFKDLLELIQLYQTYYPEPPAEIEALIEDIDLDFLSEDLTHMVSSMKVGTDRIRQIVLSLRNFSRLDESEKKSVNLHEGLESTLLILQSRLKSQAHGQGIEVIKDYSDLPPVHCYASQLNQVFLNILGNAIDILENQPEPRQITLKTEVVEESTTEAVVQWAIVRIRDNGPGMTEDVCKKIFNPFFTTKPVGQGTGMGLSISHQIVVQKHQGRLQCYSEVGQGTEFVIAIPY